MIPSIIDACDEPEEAASITDTRIQTLHFDVGSYVLVHFEQKSRTDVHYVGEIDFNCWHIVY